MVTKEQVEKAEAAWEAAWYAAAEAACDVYDEEDEAAYAEAHDKYFSLKEEYENE